MAPDGRSVYLLAEDHGRQKLFIVPAAGGAVREVGTLTAGIAGTLSTLARQRASARRHWESAVNPPEIVRIAPDTGVRTRCPLQHRTCRGDRLAAAAGILVHQLAAARGFTAFSRCLRGSMPRRSTRCSSCIHGGPHSMWIDQFVIRWNYHLLAQPGYVVLLTNYTGSTGFGEKFAQASRAIRSKGRRSRSTRRRTRPSSASPSSTVRVRPQEAPVTAGISPTGWP